MTTIQKKAKEENHDWTNRVYDVVRKIPKGRVCSYGIIAEATGARLSALMVGWAMNACHRVTPSVPAHRVVNRNGLLTGKHHFATPSLMQELLEAEGISIKEDKIINFKELLWLPHEAK